eukprot:GHVR01043448.1.p1 GENE.GHVR01043448.1~~GHVR01043448.1.p1  ORF type:complete len:189 (+),score=20.02 GHVR01043448.1:107-673(+)
MSSSSTDYENIKPEDVAVYSKPTVDFLCPLSANIYGIEFVSFKIRDVESRTTLLEVNKDPVNLSAEALQQSPDIGRMIRYNFGPDFLRLTTIGTTLEFTVGDQPVKYFRMIERHYFRDKLIKSFDFVMPFCMPNTINSWEVIYDMPKLSNTEIADMIASPWESKSDSFYFVEDKMIMHNKAEYSFSAE